MKISYRIAETIRWRASAGEDGDAMCREYCISRDHLRRILTRAVWDRPPRHNPDGDVSELAASSAPARPVDFAAWKGESRRRRLPILVDAGSAVEIDRPGAAGDHGYFTILPSGCVTWSSYGSARREEAA